MADKTTNVFVNEIMASLKLSSRYYGREELYHITGIHLNGATKKLTITYREGGRRRRRTVKLENIKYLLA